MERRRPPGPAEPHRHRHRPDDEFGAILRATLSTHVDGASSRSTRASTTSGDIVDIGNVRGTTPPPSAMVVRKRGRTTGLTHGSVDGSAVSVNVDYGDGIGVHTLTDQVSIATDTDAEPAVLRPRRLRFGHRRLQRLRHRPAVRRRGHQHAGATRSHRRCPSSTSSMRRQDADQGHQGRPQGLHQGQGSCARSSSRTRSSARSSSRTRSSGRRSSRTTRDSRTSSTTRTSGSATTSRSRRRVTRRSRTSPEVDCLAVDCRAVASLAEGCQAAASAEAATRAWTPGWPLWRRSSAR